MPGLLAESWDYSGRQEPCRLDHTAGRKSATIMTVSRLTVVDFFRFVRDILKYQ